LSPMLGVEITLKKLLNIMMTVVFAWFLFYSLLA